MLELLARRTREVVRRTATPKKRTRVSRSRSQSAVAKLHGFGGPRNSNVVGTFLDIRETLQHRFTTRSTYHPQRPMIHDPMIGKQLALLRERAELKQNELAKRLTWSAALLSRIESGERPVSDDELEMILSGINTEEATRFKERISLEWHVLPQPPLDDPDFDLLWEAEQSAQQIHALADRPDVKQFFERRLVRYETELAAAAGRVLNKRYRAAFIGTIAVGKSTAICRAAGLELPSAKPLPTPVLETGGGGITICEVHVRRGPGYGVLIDPCADDEVRHHVSDFANYLMSPAQPIRSSDDGEGENADSPGMSREVERALRFMTGLRRRRAQKKPDGTVVPAVDEARVLAASAVDVKALSVELLARMELHRRDRRDIWHSEATDKPPLEWLQDMFELVNNGRHPEFTLPKRIELVIPTHVLQTEKLAVTLIDTQGIDDVAARPNLEQHFDDPNTAVILCSVFSQAPATQVRQLLTRAKEAGVRTLETHAAILVLPHPGDALQMKDEGYFAKTAREGYDLKAEEVRLKLHPLGLTNLPLEFFNAAEDEPEVIRSFILGRIEAIRDFHRHTLREIIEGAQALLLNYEKAQTQEVIRAASRSLQTWLDHNAELSTEPTMRVHESLLAATRLAHWRSVYATVVRRGEWYSLDYAHQLSHGARRIATQLAEPKLNGFKEIAVNILNDDQFADAHDLVSQTIRILEEGFDNVVRKVQIVGSSIYADELKLDDEFWTRCGSESGRGYRDRVNGHNQAWFARHAEADARVTDIVRDNWAAAIAAVRELLPTE
jgi:transcriptional regulator with XRE-family HTH domain